MKLKRSVRVALLVAAGLTLLLPIDLVPDTIPLIGWFDDLLGILLLVQEALHVIRDRRSVSVRK